MQVPLRRRIYCIAGRAWTRELHPALALGYAGIRLAELAIAAVGLGLGGLLLVTLSATAADGAMNDTLGGLGLVGLVPGGLFELVLPIWLFAKGFKSSAVGRG